LASARANIRRLRALVPPYSINAVAAAALPAALADRAYRDRYIAESAQSRALVHACCARLGLESWGDAANFVLIDAGPRAAEVVEGLRSRGIAVRDRSSDPATPGCLRVTTGYVDDTTRLVAALEEVWCAATA
jgi:histidinol-phosphate aminotransferase